MKYKNEFDEKTGLPIGFRVDDPESMQEVREKVMSTMEEAVSVMGEMITELDRLGYYKIESKTALSQKFADSHRAGRQALQWEATRAKLGYYMLPDTGPVIWFN